MRLLIPDCSQHSPLLSLQSRRIGVCVILPSIFFLLLFSIFSLETIGGEDNNNDENSTRIRNALNRSEQVYLRYIAKRQEIVTTSSLNSIDPWSIARETYLFDYFLPSFDCPYSVERIGRMGDGGKWVCGLEVFQNHSCIVYSFGIAGDSSFEAEVINRTNCLIFAFDGSVSQLGPQISTDEAKERVKFFEKFVGNSDSGTHWTLGSIMRHLGHSWVDIVKMDIEGAEFPVLGQVMDEFEEEGLPFGQLQLEIHAGKFRDLYHFWERLEFAGLRPFMNEINHNPCLTGGKPNVCEYSFLNVKR
jgi:hypothetical protein